MPLSVAKDIGPPLALAPGLQNGGSTIPAIGGLGGAISPTRASSAGTLEVFGADFAAESVDSANYVPLASPQSYALVPGDGNEISWARFSMPNLTEDRPVQLDISVSEAKAGEGGEVLPLNYFVGVANYTQFSWDWWGPFSDDAQVSLNHPADEFELELSERYISETGVLQLLIVTGPAAGSGDCAVQVDSAMVTTSLSYVWNKPHYVWFVDAHVGSSLPMGAKRVAALQPEQFIDLAWNHVEPFSGLDYLNAPSFYQISRQAPLDGEPQAVGTAAFPGTAFNDPLDRDLGVAEPVAGTTYRYFVYAQNSAGMTIPATTTITVPILPPEGVSASLNAAAPGFTLVSWGEVVGAIGYEVWRGLSPIAGSSEMVGNPQGGALSFEDTTALPGIKYWYFLRSLGFGDGDGSNGLEEGSVSGYSMGAEGLRSVELTIAGIEPSVNGAGTQADPFVLASGITYQFKAHDQTGRELTVGCFWETIPTLAGGFDEANAGLLDGIQPAPNEFLAQATYSIIPYFWVGSAYCMVE